MESINAPISVVVAIKNEEQHIARCLDSLLELDFPSDEYRIVVVDGMSEDGTMSIVETYRDRYPQRITIVMNPQGTQAAGRNLGFRSYPESEYVAYIDGHCIADRRWLRTLFMTFEDSNDPKIAGVGSVHQSPQDDTPTGKAIGEIYASVIGGGGSSFRSTKRVKEVPTAPYVLYRRNALEKAGYYDETLKGAEDFALNSKLREVGYRILVNPNALVFYYKRGSCQSFFNQMYTYGSSKAILMRHGYSIPLFNLIPAATILGFIVLGSVSVIEHTLAPVLASALLAYLVTVLSFSVAGGIRQKQMRLAGLMAILFVIEHFAYGFGFLAGALRRRGR